MEVPIKIGPFERTYVLAITSAPSRYDYDVIELQEYGGHRLVLIAKNRLQEQTDRNASGIHWTSTEQVDIQKFFWVSEWDVADILYRRLRGIQD